MKLKRGGYYKTYSGETCRIDSADSEFAWVSVRKALRPYWSNGEFAGIGRDPLAAHELDIKKEVFNVPLMKKIGLLFMMA